MRYSTWEDKLTPLYRMLIGVIIIIIGLTKQMLSGKTLEMYSYYIMVFGALLVANAFILKISKERVNIILYPVVSLVMLIAGIYIRESFDKTILYSIYVGMFIVIWIVNAILISVDDGIKRAVLGFVSALINTIFMAIIFLIPVLLAAFNH